MDELQKLKAQRDGLARYIFERNDGGLYWSHCCGEMENGRCPYRAQFKDWSCTPGVCIPCIVAMIGEGGGAPPSPFFSLLAEYHLLVTYFVIGGTLATGRVQAVENGTITFQVRGRDKCYRLEEIDVIVPREVLRWSHDELTPATWQAGNEDVAEPEASSAPFSDISSCLLSIGIQPYMEGFAEINTAIRLAVEKPALLERLGDRLYPALAEALGKSTSAVSYRLARGISAARRNSRETGRYQAFYSAIPGRNINIKAFLSCFLRYLCQGDDLSS